MKVKPRGGVNNRLPAHEIGPNQWALMHNVDMTHDLFFTQIPGSIRFNGTSFGNIPASAIMPCYDNFLDTADVLAAVEGKIYKKNFGSNEFEEILSGLQPNKIRFYVSERGKVYFPHPTDGLFEYDGSSKVSKVNDILLKDIIISKETNKAFGVRADNPLAYNWTDDLVEMSGVPIVWNPINTDTVPSNDGDSIEKIMFFKGRLTFFLTNTIWIEYVNGAPENWRYEKITTTVGCVAPKTVKLVKNEIWFLGNSPQSGIGLYAFDGINVRLLSYDAEGVFKRINTNRIDECCAEFYNNIYKLSFPLDSDIQNSWTYHVDSINYNPDTELPNFYGPHTYGFNASAVLNTKKLGGTHLFSYAHSSGSFIFKEHESLYQYSSGVDAAGDLIPTVLISGIFSEEKDAKSSYDMTWIKRYEKMYMVNPPGGNWSSTVDVLTDFGNQPVLSFDQWMDGGNYKIDSLFLDVDAFDSNNLYVDPHINDVLASSIQFKISNLQVNKKFRFDSINYDFRPVRRLKNCRRVRV